MKKAILRVFFKPLTIINRIKKKDEKLIFFYSNLGFRDNVKAFYDYLIENNYNEKELTLKIMQSNMGNLI